MSSVKLTPTGTQSAEVLTLRRLLVAGLNLGLFAVLALWAARVLGEGGWSVVDALLFVAFLAILPWTILGFWNAIIGLFVLHGVRDPLAAVAPFAPAEGPLTTRTGVLMTLRNEDAARAITRLRAIREDVEATGQGSAFGWFVLSDTNDPAIAATEEAEVARWQAEAGAAVTYRRREDNAGFKAGNLREFLLRWGDEFDFALPLDADSLMTGQTILHLARLMQAHPKLGILQSLVVGLPSNSAFARVFQFGMRQGMRSYSNGQAWWVGDCGPFWGHNALFRVKPFRDDCNLPLVPGKPPLGGPILSHDQVEAVLMRRAGFEVRLYPVESGSYEENPPTVLEYMRRNTRWCLGNLQYLRLLDMPGLKPVSRFQMVWAILMFLSVPGWTALTLLAALKPFDGEVGFPTSAALGLYLTFLVMNQMPKLAGLADIFLTKGEAARYGGALRVLLAGVLEMAHSWVMGAIDSFRITVFMVGLAFGQRIEWGGQARDAHGVSWQEASANLWPQTLFGMLVVGLMLIASPALALWALPLTLGYVAAIPFCVASAAPAAGAFLRRHHLFAVPEEFNPPAVLSRLSSVAPAQKPE